MPPGYLCSIAAPPRLTNTQNTRRVDLTVPMRVGIVAHSAVNYAVLYAYFDRYRAEDNVNPGGWEVSRKLREYGTAEARLEG